MFLVSCTLIGFILFFLGSSSNGLCILVFLRKKFRHRIITPYFIVLLFADSVYLLFHLIKLFYYSQTLFHLNIDAQDSCSKTFFARAYQYATQTWPQPLVPLLHSETYMRFSVILMCIVSIHRAKVISCPLERLAEPQNRRCIQKHRWAFFFIIIAFCLAYLFEFMGLTLFCSKSNNRDISYGWFLYMSKHMPNSSYLLTDPMTDQPDLLKCVNSALKMLRHNPRFIQLKKDSCTEEELVEILSYYFDQHQRSTVNLIRKILYHQTGQNITRNEIRRKYHFHECFFPQEPNFFHRNYNFMYDRIFGLNRYTLILVFGSIVPSFLTIISNILSIYRVNRLRRSTKLVLPCHRRTDDTRRVLIVITIECLFAIVNSWFSDIVLSVVFCKRNLLADEDCPMFLKQNINLLITFDMLNSISNIILHCLCGKRFRNELITVFYSIGRTIKHILIESCCCYLRINVNPNDEEHRVWYHATVTENNSPNNTAHSSSSNQLYIVIQPSSPFPRYRNFQCECLFNGRPLFIIRDYLFSIVRSCFRQNDRYRSVNYHSISVMAGSSMNTRTPAGSTKVCVSR